MMIDLLPNEDQQQIADSVQRFLMDNLPVERFRAAKGGSAPKLDREFWGDLAELGSFGLSLPEEHGGVGLSVVEEIMVFREYGRFLVSPTILGTVLAGHVAITAGQSDLAGEFVAGSRCAAVMSPLHGATLGPKTSGSFHMIDSGNDDLLIAWDDAGAAAFERKAAASIEQIGCIDATVGLERATFKNAAPLCYVTAGDKPIALMANILLGASFAGMIEAIRDLSVDYAKIREQFGHPIGIFQGVKHRCSDMAMWAEAAWCQTAWAALSLESGSSEAAFQATNAKAIGASAALDAARRAVQIFGGMGFTAEVNVHLFLKRAHVYEQLSGATGLLQEKLLDLPLEI